MSGVRKPSSSPLRSRNPLSSPTCPARALTCGGPAHRKRRPCVFKPPLPEAAGVEEHLFRALHTLRTFQPHLVVVDALSSTLRMGTVQAAFEVCHRLFHAC